MKMFKKFAALAMAAVMTVGMMAPAMAAAINNRAGGKIIVNQAVEGAEYHAYQMLLADKNGLEETYEYYVVQFPNTDDNTEVNPWWDFFKNEELGGKYFTVLEDQGRLVNVRMQYPVIWSGPTEETEQATAAAELARLAIQFVKDNNIPANGEATADDSGSVTIELRAVEGRADRTAGYYLVDTTVGSLCMLDTITGEVIIEEKNIQPQLKVDIWENYTDDGTYVDFGGKNSNVDGTWYAGFSFGDEAYLTAQITIGNGNGTMDYLVRRCDTAWENNGLRPYYRTSTFNDGEGKSTLLSVAKKDENGSWVKLTEGEDWIYTPEWKENAKIGWDIPDYTLSYEDRYIWLNSFKLEPGDEIAVTWKYLAMGNAQPLPNYGGWYESSGENKGWHRTYDYYDCTLEYGVPEQAWKDWDAEKAYYQTTKGAGIDRVLDKLEDIDGALFSGVQILKTDGNGNPLSGAEFELYWDAACTQPVYFAREDDDGRYYQIPERADDEDVYYSSSNPVLWEILDCTVHTSSYSGLFEAAGALYAEDIQDWENALWAQLTGDPERDEIEKKTKLISPLLKDDGNGLYTLVGLKPGTYWLKETTAPDGYNKLTEAQAITVKAVPYIFSGDEYDYSEGGTREVVYDDMGYPIYNGQVDENGFALPVPEEVVAAQFAERLKMVEEKIVNLSGLELPHTGGIGTTIFYVVGGLLVVGAGILLVVKKRMKSEDTEK